ncbi:hypothetical protein [Ferrimonas marina]|nr:hypothetical protein [Ferrimonas marina]
MYKLIVDSPYEPDGLTEQTFASVQEMADAWRGSLITGYCDGTQLRPADDESRKAMRAAADLIEYSCYYDEERCGAVGLSKEQFVSLYGDRARDHRPDSESDPRFVDLGDSVGLLVKTHIPRELYEGSIEWQTYHVAGGNVDWTPIAVNKGLYPLLYPGYKENDPSCKREMARTGVTMVGSICHGAQNHEYALVWVRKDVAQAVDLQNLSDLERLTPRPAIRTSVDEKDYGLEPERSVIYWVTPVGEFAGPGEFNTEAFADDLEVGVTGFCNSKEMPHSGSVSRQSLPSALHMKDGAGNEVGFYRVDREVLNALGALGNRAYISGEDGGVKEVNRGDWFQVEKARYGGYFHASIVPCDAPDPALYRKLTKEEELGADGIPF